MAEIGFVPLPKKNGWEKLSEISKVWNTGETFPGSLSIGYLPENSVVSDYDIICVNVDISVTATSQVTTTGSEWLDFRLYDGSSTRPIVSIDQYWEGGDSRTTKNIVEKKKKFFGNFLGFPPGVSVDLSTRDNYNSTIWGSAIYINAGSHIKITTYGKKIIF